MLQAVLDAAAEVFLEVGFERAKMTQISARLCGSKGTLYSYFKSKDELFTAAMLDTLEKRGVELHESLTLNPKDLRTVLIGCAKVYLDLILSPNSLALVRTAVGASRNSDFGARLYERAPRKGIDEMTTYFEHLKEINELDIPDPHIAAVHFKGLLEAGILEPMMFGATPELSMEKSIPLAVDCFLKAYGWQGPHD